MTLRLTLSANWIARAASAAILLLGALSLATHPLGLEVFQLDAEANVPTWFSSLLLMLCSVPLAVIGQAKREERAPHARFWSVLAVLFLYLSLDELAQLHDKLNLHLQSVFHPSGYLAFPWVLPAAIAVTGVAIASVPWLRTLPDWVRARFLLSAVLYVGGALGVETISAGYASVHGMESWGYTLLSHLEELLEMSGAAFFLTTLVRYAGAMQVEVRLEVAAEQKEVPFLVKQEVPAAA
ncbi:MAG TPA: hypothetical protein V6D05_19005 [Stenomitos sp.]